MTATALSWSEISGIQPQDWDLLVESAEQRLATTARLHRLRCRTGKLALQRAYERSLGRYEDSLRHLVRFAPSYLFRIASAARVRATQLEMEINVVWEESETEFEDLCQKVDRHLVLLGQLKALEAVVAGVKGVKVAVDAGPLDARPDNGAARLQRRLL